VLGGQATALPKAGTGEVEMIIESALIVLR
jgi:hypothetical protein